MHACKRVETGTKDLLCVKKILGYKHIDNTLKYIDMEAMIFKTTSDEFTVKVANSVEEAYALLEVGFEYMTDEYNDGAKSSESESARVRVWYIENSLTFGRENT